MAILQCYFAESPQLELTRTVFDRPLPSGKIESVRGKSAGAHTGRGSFQWTPAVRALCLLLVRSAASSQRGQNSAQPILQTSSRGAVSALDYALSRKASWITEMFGADSAGDPIARRLFRRSNPERKRPGPLAISLNLKFLAAHEIEIIVDGELITDPLVLDDFAQSLTKQCDWEIALGYDTVRKASDADTGYFLNELRPHFLRELRLMLKATNIFSPRALREALGDMERTPALQPIRSDFLSSIEEVDLKLAGSERLGLALQPDQIETLFPSGEPLRFGVTPSQIGTIALLRFLRDLRNLPIEIDYSFAHTSDLAKGITSGGSNNFPDCCVMTTASALLLRSRSEYRPLMVMPAATHSILGPSHLETREALSSPAEYLFLCDFPTTPRFWFDSLTNSGVISGGSVRCSHVEPDETLSIIQSNDRSLRAILWFPYNVICQAQSPMVPLLHAPARGAGLGFVQNVLFIHNSLARNTSRKRLLDILLRDAWLHLLEDERLCATLIQSQLEEQDYIRCLWRYGGLYRSEDQSGHNWDFNFVS